MAFPLSDGTETVGNLTTFLASIRANFSLLEKPKVLIAFGEAIADELGLNVKTYHKVTYDREIGVAGYTATVYLAESHILFETYPEYSMIEFEMASCRRLDSEDIERALRRHFDLISFICLQKLGVGWSVSTRNKVNTST